MNLKEKITSAELLDNQIGLFYTGQVGFIIKYNGKYVMIDGYLSDYVDRNCCDENVKWIRKYPAPISGSDLDFIDYVFCTHAHFDHTDPYTIRDLLSVNRKAKFIISDAISDCLPEYGVPMERIIRVNADTNYTLCEKLSFVPVAAAHEELHRDEKGRFLELGFKIKFGNTVLFHSGDGCMYDGLTESIANSDILILPINGRDYFRNRNDIIGCFDSREAVLLAKETKAKLLIPVHFDLYSVNEVNPAFFVDTLYSLNPSQEFHIFMPGEKYIFSL